MSIPSIRTITDHFKSGKYNETGDPVGEWREWFDTENHQLASVYRYNDDGQLQGKQESWHENGQSYKVMTFEKGEAIGEWTEYYENGAKRAEGKYVDGSFDGQVPAAVGGRISSP